MPRGDADMSLFTHVPHPHIAKHKDSAPVKVADQATGLNGRIALKITGAVGTMICAYLFALLALVSLPAALRSGDPVVLVSWVSQTFLQLVLLSVIIVGQNIQAATSDKRAQDTYDDAESVLHEALQIQAHLAAQDTALENLIARAGGTA